MTTPTHDKDGLGFYIATLHTVDVCRYKAELGNAATVAVCPLNDGTRLVVHVAMRSIRLEVVVTDTYLGSVTETLLSIVMLSGNAARYLQTPLVLVAKRILWRLGASAAVRPGR